MPWILIILPFLAVLTWLSRHSDAAHHDRCRPGHDHHGHHHGPHGHHHGHRDEPYGWQCWGDDKDGHCRCGDDKDGHCRCGHDQCGGEDAEPQHHEGHHDHGRHAHHPEDHPDHDDPHHEDRAHRDAPNHDAPHHAHGADEPHSNPWASPAPDSSHVPSAEEVGAQEASPHYPDPTADDVAAGPADAYDPDEEPTVTHPESLPDETSEEFRSSLPDDRVVGPDAATEAEMSGWLGEVGEVLADEDLDGPDHPSEVSSEDEELSHPESWSDQDPDHR